MTPLAEIIRREITQCGPMSVARFMELCLAHPEYGYYRTRDPLGARGDFTTAPEISQMFGEMVGIWLVEVWRGMGEPELKLIELGPGRGTLMADALRVMARTGMADAVEIWFVETSPVLRAQQRHRVPAARWADRLEDVPRGPTIVLANEFFDALPVRQFLCAGDGWRERVVGIEDDRLIWGLSAPLSDQSGTSAGAWTEISAVTETVASLVARRLTKSPGAALIIDYGYRLGERPPGPTLQAVRGHEGTDPLEAPGSADLTWLVDFDVLEGVFRTAGHRTRVVTQGAFLTALGIGRRAEALAAAKPDQSAALADALERLTGEAAMGTLFKALSAVSIGLPTPPGFEESH